MPRPPQHHPNRAIAASLLFISLILLSGCGTRQIGHGVLLWSPDEERIASGTVVDVVSQSELNDTYELRVSDPEENLTVKRWRVEFFDNVEAATAYSSDYRTSLQDNPRLYARARRNALPLRSTPNSIANNIVYRLRENESIKLIGRQAEETNLEGLVSYWYEGLTETGVRGWVFGYTLDIYDPLDEDVVVESGAGDDPLVDLLLQSTWRPIYFLDMIANGAIDLELFRPEFGLFPDPEARTLELVLPWHATTFRYEAIASVGPRKYLAEGTDLQLTFQRNDELSIQYLLDGRQHILALQRIDGEIDEYIQAELDRREAVYTRLTDRGPAFVSDNYGALEFLEDQRFSWAGYDRLVPRAIPAGAGTSGTVDLGLFVAVDLMQNYDGGLQLKFDGVSKPVNFLYTFRGNAIRMTYVPDSDVQDRVVQRESMTPLTLFFSSTGG